MGCLFATNAAVIIAKLTLLFGFSYKKKSFFIGHVRNLGYICSNLNDPKDMKPTEQTIQQIGRSIKKIAQKFPPDEDTSILTDIHLRVSQDSGELVAFDDEDREITRCVVEQWIDNQDEDFYNHITAILRAETKRMSNTIDNMGIMKPFSIVLEDEDQTAIADLYLADDDTIILGDDLMQGLDQDLDNFFEQLMK